jgi:hypothetical protein
MKRRAVVIATSIVALAIASFFGSIAGWLVGYGDALGRSAPSTAAYSVSMLKTLRSGNTEQTISMLETQLDGALMERWAFERSRHMLMSTFLPETVAGKLMGVAAKYRIQYPTDSRDAEVKAAIAVVFDKYTGSPQLPTK